MAEIVNVPVEWLTGRTSLDQLVEQFRDLPVSIRESALQEVTRFASTMEKTDELWTFSSPSESWERKCGSSGLAILRNGEIAAAYQLMMN